MSDDKTKTVYATFATREAADLAVEHLVQQHGIDRADIFVEAAGPDNTAGMAASGGDAESGLGGDDRTDGALAGAIQISVDVSADAVASVQDALREVGGKMARVA
ncbi:hypothetical protein QCN27_12695 [Cereibacter sp. SYSU M97828]|nr:hypothetical protein [Cereibacter flavus]